MNEVLHPGNRNLPSLYIDSVSSASREDIASGRAFSSGQKASRGYWTAVAPQHREIDPSYSQAGKHWPMVEQTISSLLTTENKDSKGGASRGVCELMTDYCKPSDSFLSTGDGAS